MEIKPQSMAIPKGTDHLKLPKTPACYGFSCVARVKPGFEEYLYKNAKIMEKAIEANPDTLFRLKTHSRWVTFTSRGRPT